MCVTRETVAQRMYMLRKQFQSTHGQRCNHIQRVYIPRGTATQHSTHTPGHIATHKEYLHPRKQLYTGVQITGGTVIGERAYIQGYDQRAHADPGKQPHTERATSRCAHRETQACFPSREERSLTEQSRCVPGSPPNTGGDRSPEW